MDWTHLQEDGFDGLETFLSDGTAIDIVSYQNGPWCWMIRVPIQDNYETHEIYASYDDDIYFNDLVSTLDSAMQYLEEQFPNLYYETQYQNNIRQEKIGLLQKATMFGLAACFSATLMFGLAAPPQALADEINNNDISVVDEEDDFCISQTIINGRDVYFVSDTPYTVMSPSEVRSETLDIVSKWMNDNGYNFEDWMLQDVSVYVSGDTLGIEFKNYSQNNYHEFSFDNNNSLGNGTYTAQFIQIENDDIDKLSEYLETNGVDVIYIEDTEMSDSDCLAILIIAFVFGALITNLILIRSRW